MYSSISVHLQSIVTLRGCCAASMLSSGQLDHRMVSNTLHSLCLYCSHESSREDTRSCSRAELPAPSESLPLLSGAAHEGGGAPPWFYCSLTVLDRVENLMGKSELQRDSTGTTSDLIAVKRPNGVCGVRGDHTSTHTHKLLKYHNVCLCDSFVSYSDCRFALLES